jgi:glyceraldehyde-3-phosphate dehydrogenase (NADP+)
MSVGARIEAVQALAAGMQKAREQSVRLLMWEIGKTRGDSEKEFDRTVQYILDTVEALKEIDRAAGRFSASAGILAQIRRARSSGAVRGRSTTLSTRPSPPSSA